MHPDQEQAFEIFAHAWHIDNENIKDASEALCTSATKAKDSGVHIWSTILAIHQHACVHPASIDLMLSIFDRAIQQYPDTVKNEYGAGPAAGKQQLKYWLIEEVTRFQGMQFHDSAGTIDSHDRSNLEFSQKEVIDNKSGVIAQIEEWKKCRRDQLISAAIFARCHALDIFRISDGKQAASLIDMGLNHDWGHWSHSDFLAACILLRGCANSLLLTLKEDKIDEWRSLFTRHLREQDFILKSHAALVIRNLDDGPWDETSQSLFSWDRWLL